MSIDISIHAPRVGRDGPEGHRRWLHHYFNPRAPCGARPAAPAEDYVTRKISIHAPRVGRDNRLATANLSAQIFQSTRPVWGATPPHGIDAEMVVKFQSTRPVWGATSFLLSRAHGFVISIHAPRVGRDELASRERKALTRFQSTRPVWGATDCRSRGRLSSRISIHAPRVGRDHALPSPPA